MNDSRIEEDPEEMILDLESTRRGRAHSVGHDALWNGIAPGIFRKIDGG